ncbi:MAG: D-alanyl-D-alanine carboxypeptidase [Ruminococcaceae bacterium]|nr:D-alanyl-D-alanine carboxypeptidase [Oscillospiraceae bacterium]
MKNPRERIISAMILIVLLLFIYMIAVSSAAEPTVSARSAVLYEPAEKSFLFEKNADERLPMASTTKIMTALLAIENLSPDEEITVVPEACGIEGSSLYLKPGEILTASDLIMGMMLRSANDAAAALAYAVSGGIPEFAALMNERAASMGLRNTSFSNPHGLDGEEHYTTARELAIISAVAMSDPTFKSVVSTKSCTITNKDGYRRLVTNHNKLLSLYEGATGVKTGYTKKSGRCLVGAAEKDGISLISVTISAPDDWNDHMKMFNYGFGALKGPDTHPDDDVSLIPTL